MGGLQGSEFLWLCFRRGGSESQGSDGWSPKVIEQACCLHLKIALRKCVVALLDLKSLRSEL